jgi:hypothetical protein
VHYFVVLQTLKLNSKKTEKKEEHKLVELTSDQERLLEQQKPLRKKYFQAIIIRSS